MPHTIQNDDLRVTVVENGGHIAEIFHKKSGVNPLWIPPWSAQDRPDCGDGVDARLLADIMGHNVCVDVFGPPSTAQAVARTGVPGKHSVRACGVSTQAGGPSMGVR